MLDGVINVNKPAGWTSQDVCAKLRSRLHIKKTGHTGTLDPMATGVLPVCVGKATRIIEYYDKDIKSYRAVMKLGITTDTLDSTGEIISTGDPSNVSENDVAEAFKAYTGRITQVPPKYSALKINGKRAYDLARQGADFELKGREITIYKNEVMRFDREAGEIGFDVSCSKGTYIRSLCADIGEALGCGGCMSALRRIKAGDFEVSQAHTLSEVQCAADAGEAESLLLPVDSLFASLPEYTANAAQERRIKVGNEIPTALPDGEYRVYSQSREFLMLGRAEAGMLKTVKSFFEV